MPLKILVDYTAVCPHIFIFLATMGYKKQIREMSVRHLPPINPPKPFNTSLRPGQKLSEAIRYGVVYNELYVPEKIWFLSF